MIVEIIRSWQDEDQTTGTCNVYDNDGRLVFSALSLERGDRNNERNVSCVPTGEYEIRLEWSNRFQQRLWELKGVPGRSECKFHAANYWYQLNGCIALGLDLKDINRDGYRDVTSSRTTMKRFHKAMDAGDSITARLIIKNRCC